MHFSVPLRGLVAFGLAAAAGSVAVAGSRATVPQPFAVEEATIASVHRAFDSGQLSCRLLVTEYLRRIEAYDADGPALTAIVTINSHALTIADSLDRRWQVAGPVGPLHCIPFVVKDNIATAGLRTTVGSAALAQLVPQRDAVAIQQIKAAGAVILAKGHLAEFGLSYARTKGSILAGETRNPYALDYSPGGSSGGVAAAVAANLALAGLASETGKSIRGPAAFTSLVGLRTTAGVTSVKGVAPLRPATVGPMTRTVADMATVLSVLAAGGPADSSAPGDDSSQTRGYASALDAGGMRGARIAIARQRESGFLPDSAFLDLFERALSDMRGLGAILVDSLPVDSILNMPFEPRRAAGAPARRCSTFKFDLDDWLHEYGTASAPRLAELLASGRVLPSDRSYLERAAAVDTVPAMNPECAPSGFPDSVHAAIIRIMDSARVDAIIYPTWVTAPAKVGGQRHDDPEMLSLLASAGGLPSITVPMGYTEHGIPAGLEFLGRRWQEPTLLRLAYAYEQGTHHRCAPASAPPLHTSPSAPACSARGRSRAPAQ